MNVNLVNHNFEMSGGLFCPTHWSKRVKYIYCFKGQLIKLNRELLQVAKMSWHDQFLYHNYYITGKLGVTNLGLLFLKVLSGQDFSRNPGN